MMMMTTTVEAERFPIVEAGDAEEVVLALETGRALWGQGDPREAVRWLRRAAEHAEESGNDLRALSLARVAADLTTIMQSPQTVPVPPRHDELADATEATPAPQRASKLPKLTSPPARPSATASVTPRPPAPSAVAKAASPAAPALKSVTPALPPVAPAALNGVHAAPANKLSSLPPQRASVMPQAPTPSKSSVAPRPAATTAQSPVLQHAKSKRRGAVRVAVRRQQSGDGWSLQAEILDEGQPVPADAVEALIVPLDPNADLLSVR